MADGHDGCGTGVKAAAMNQAEPCGMRHGCMLMALLISCAATVGLEVEMMMYKRRVPRECQGWS